MTGMHNPAAFLLAGGRGASAADACSPHPKDFPDRLLHVIADHPNICNAVHLPLQSGNDRILKRMNRGYTRQEYLDLVDLMRDVVPGIALTTDIICGFPTETAEEYLDTEGVVKAVGFESAFIFKYSERMGTVAARRHRDDITTEEKSRRVTRLVNIQREISRAKNEERIGRVERVLIEGVSKKDSGEWRARNDGNTIVVFRDPARCVGDFCDVKIARATPNTLIGQVYPPTRK